MSITGDSELINVNNADMKIASPGYAFVLSNGSKIMTSTGASGGILLDSNVVTGTGTSMGIGTSTQSSVLSVVGTNPYSSAAPEEGVHIGENDEGYASIEMVAADNKGFIDFTKPNQDYFYRLISNLGSRNNFEIYGPGGLALTINQDSQVGIGTTSPSANLHVVGNVHATGLISGDGGGLSNVSGGGGGAAIYCSYKGSGNQGLGTSYGIIMISQQLENSDNTADFTLSSGVITIKNAGVYLMAFNISTSTTSGTTRTDSSAYLGRNGSQINGTKVYMYNRTVTVGENTGSATRVMTLDANDTISIYARIDNGTGPVTCLRDDTQISLYKIA